MAPADGHLSWTSGDFTRLLFATRATLPSRANHTTAELIRTSPHYKFSSGVTDDAARALEKTEDPEPVGGRRTVQ